MPISTVLTVKVDVIEKLAPISAPSTLLKAVATAPWPCVLVLIASANNLAPVVKEEKSAAKTEVCAHEHATFEAERDLVAQIKAKIEKLATIRDDTTGENAAAADAPDASPARL